jgi:nucleoside-specific outer membrane channel protein Tsx
MQLVIISVALLASIAACTVNVFSQDAPVHKDSVWTSQVTYVDTNSTQITPEKKK